MDDLRKAAVLLLSLDKPVAAEVLAQLPRHLVEAVTLEVAKLDDITQDQQQGVLDEFSVLAKARGHIERGGIEFAEQLLAQSLGDENSGEILDAIKQSINAVPFAFLHKAGVDQLLTFLVDEHPQTIALIMSHLPPSMAAEVLSGLPPHKQIDVVRRVASMEGTSPEVVADIEESLRSRMTSLFDRQSEKAGGVPLVAEILNISDRMTNKGILESLEDDSPELVEEIKRLM
ncbi:MAG: flagellar motor switch protein FliG, partial [Planctomycetota bacterium]